MIADFWLGLTGFDLVGKLQACESQALLLLRQLNCCVGEQILMEDGMQCSLKVGAEATLSICRLVFLAITCTEFLP